MFVTYEVIIPKNFSTDLEGVAQL